MENFTELWSTRKNVMDHCIKLTIADSNWKVQRNRPSVFFNLFYASHKTRTATMQLRKWKWLKLPHNLLLAASRSQMRMEPDWDPATISSSLVLIFTLSTGVVWPVKLWKNEKGTLNQWKKTPPPALPTSRISSLINIIPSVPWGR